MSTMSASTAKLSALPFMDLYLNAEGTQPPRYRSLARDKSNVWSQPLPAEYHTDAWRLCNQLLAESHETDSAYVYEGVRFRVARQRMANGQMWIVLRRINAIVPKLEDLGYAPHIASYLRNLGRRDGLILFSGATGHGKTTTCFSLMQDYLQQYGGVGITIEDPVEYILEGAIGDHGYSYQVQVEHGEDWAEHIKRSLRWTPRYLLVGEIRTPAAAEQVLRAATTGHLVLSTIHAGSIEDSILGLQQLASQKLQTGTRNILAQALTAAVHQTLQDQKPYIRYIFTEENNNGDPVRALIREDRVGMINTYIERQIARMDQRTGNLPPPPAGTATFRKQ